mgnify:CR=1 FL=1
MGRDDQTAVSVAELRVHTHYLTRGQTTFEQRLSTLEAEQRRHGSILLTMAEIPGRQQRVEAAVALLKVAAGLLMFVLARSGHVTGEGARVLEKAGGALLGVF